MIFQKFLPHQKSPTFSAQEKPPLTFTKNTAPKNTARRFPTFRPQALQTSQHGQLKNLQKNIEKRFCDLYKGAFLHERMKTVEFQL